MILDAYEAALTRAPKADHRFRIEHCGMCTPQIIDRMAAALAEWLPMHASTMDAGLVQHMKNVKFDSRTETLADPSLVKPATMSGCGSVSCS